MFIKTIEDRIRRDFFAVYECEHCGFQEKGRGYDDSNFHNNVIPKMKCSSCGKTAGASYVPAAPRYPDNLKV